MMILILTESVPVDTVAADSPPLGIPAQHSQSKMSLTPLQAPHHKPMPGESGKRRKSQPRQATGSPSLYRLCSLTCAIALKGWDGIFPFLQLCLQANVDVIYQVREEGQCESNGCAVLL